MDTDTVQIFVMNGVTSSDKIDELEIKCADESQVNPENVQEITNICRICATVTDLVIHIFDGEGLQNNLADKIHKHLPIKVSVQDILPRVVCYQCSSTLLAWHELVQCCQQADTALRQSVANRDKKANESLTEMKSDPKSLSLFTDIVRGVLTDYCHTLNIDQENSDICFVCQECAAQPMSNSIENLSQHLKLVHKELNTKKSIEHFIKENVIIEEALISEEVCDDVSTKRDTEKRIPNYFCPFCASVFSSPTRLYFHLNMHVEVCIDDGVYCCEQLYNDKKSFVAHIQSRHVRKVTEATHACKSCGLAASDPDELQKHINKSHPEAEDKYEKGKTEPSPRCQKFIPAVCPECDKTFSNKYNMLVHLRNHSAGASRFACDRCDRSYRSRGGLAQHRRAAHEGRLPFVCARCGEAFPARAARDVHARLHSGLTPYGCGRCGKAFRAKNTLDRHMDMHLNVRKYVCRVCGKKFRKSSHLRWPPPGELYRSERRESDVDPDDRTDVTDAGSLGSRGGPDGDEDDEPLAALAAGRPSEAYRNFCRALENFRDHFVKHQKNRSRRSDFSDSSEAEEVRRSPDPDPNRFDDLTSGNMRKDKMDERTRLELSQVRTEIDGRTYFACGICDKKLSSSHTYVFHRRIHTGERPCVCHVCGKQFRAPGGLARHVAETHERARRPACAACHRSFANSQNLKQHMRIHSGERPYECALCGKRFTQSGSLHAHRGTHAARAPHACRDCGARFRLRSVLARHRLLHSGERPHACTHCGKAFRQRHELNAHASIHSDGRPHACDVCGAAFRQRRALREHRRRLHADRPADAAPLYGQAADYVLTLDSV